MNWRTVSKKLKKKPNNINDRPGRINNKWSSRIELMLLTFHNLAEKVRYSIFMTKKPNPTNAYITWSKDKNRTF